MPFNQPQYGAPVPRMANQQPQGIANQRWDQNTQYPAWFNQWLQHQSEIGNISDPGTNSSTGYQYSFMPRPDPNNPRPRKRGGAASGGAFNMAKAPDLSMSPVARMEARSMTRGPIVSAVPGRTDAHFTHVPSGSYVVPADIVSGRGQGNTLAGMNVLQKLFRMGPYRSSPGKIVHGRGAPAAPRPMHIGAGDHHLRLPKVGKFMSGGGKGGNDSHIGKPVRVNLAGGELVIPPENLIDVVHPNIKVAHEIMDRWVLNERKRLRKTLAKLPGPVKS